MEKILIVGYVRAGKKHTTQALTECQLMNAIVAELPSQRPAGRQQCARVANGKKCKFNGRCNGYPNRCTKYTKRIK